ncbi:MAG: hypothetical protein ACI8QT_001379 [Halioglobus sp.]|jgi:hypothetical protein
MSELNRAHPRHAFEGKIFIELLASDIENNQPGEIIQCTTLDVSLSGLRVGINRALEVGAILQVGVDLSEAEDIFYLAGEVKWCCRDDKGETVWLAGFELLNATDTDLEFWRQAVKAIPDRAGEADT